MGIQVSVWEIFMQLNSYLSPKSAPLYPAVVVSPVELLIENPFQLLVSRNSQKVLAVDVSLSQLQLGCATSTSTRCFWRALTSLLKASLKAANHNQHKRWALVQKISENDADPFNCREIRSKIESRSEIQWKRKNIMLKPEWLPNGVSEPWVWSKYPTLIQWNKKQRMIRSRSLKCPNCASSGLRSFFLVPRSDFGSKNDQWGTQQRQWKLNVRPDWVLFVGALFQSGFWFQRKSPKEVNKIWVSTSYNHRLT